MIDTLSGGIVPAAEQPRHQPRRQPHTRPEILARQVTCQVPDVACRGQAITDVQGVRAGARAVTESALIAQHHVIAGQVQPRKSQRVERQVALVMVMDARQTVQPGDTDVPITVRVRHQVRGVHAGMDWRSRVVAHQVFEHVLCTAVLIQPVMEQGQLHESCSPVCFCKAACTGPKVRRWIAQGPKCCSACWCRAVPYPLCWRKP